MGGAGVGNLEQEQRPERWLVGEGRRAPARKRSGDRTSRPQVLVRGDDVLDGDGGMPAGGGVVERLEGEVVGRAQVAAADLEDRIEGAVVERGVRGAGDRAAVRDVLGELVASALPLILVG
jgi:hypothetical protein